MSSARPGDRRRFDRRWKELFAVVTGRSSERVSRRLSWPQRTALLLGVLLAVWGVFDLARGAVPSGILHAVAGVLIGSASVSTRAIRVVGPMVSVAFLVVFAFGIGQPGGPMDAGVVGNAVHLLIGFASVAVTESCAWCEQRAQRAARLR